MISEYVVKLLNDCLDIPDHELAALTGSGTDQEMWHIVRSQHMGYGIRYREGVGVRMTKTINNTIEYVYQVIDHYPVYTYVSYRRR